LGPETQSSIPDINHGEETMLIYSPTVWWPRVRYKVSILELHKLQRLACLAFIGAVQTPAAAEMDVPQGFFSLNVKVEVEA